MLWVGGKERLTGQGIIFSQNDLNIRLHEQVAEVSIEARKIESIDYKISWFTGII